MILWIFSCQIQYFCPKRLFFIPNAYFLFQMLAFSFQRMETTQSGAPGVFFRTIPTHADWPGTLEWSGPFDRTPNSQPANGCVTVPPRPIRGNYQAARCSWTADPSHKSQIEQFFIQNHCFFHVFPDRCLQNWRNSKKSEAGERWICRAQAAFSHRKYSFFAPPVRQE